MSKASKARPGRRALQQSRAVRYATFRGKGRGSAVWKPCGSNAASSRTAASLAAQTGMAAACSLTECVLAGWLAGFPPGCTPSDDRKRREPESRDQSPVGSRLEHEAWTVRSDTITASGWCGPGSRDVGLSPPLSSSLEKRALDIHFLVWKKTRGRAYLTSDLSVQ